MTEKERKERNEKRLQIAYRENGLNSRGLPLTESADVVTTCDDLPTMEDGGRITAREIINRIEDVKESFEISQGITNWKKESPSMFTAFCIKVGMDVFDNGKKNLLKVNQTAGEYPNRSFYDVDLLDTMYQYYKTLCLSFDVPVRVSDFADFVGMRKEVIYHKCDELTSSVRALFQKINTDNETSLESVGIGGKRNSLVIMASLNHRHGWNKEQIQTESEKPAVTCQELPRLGTAND